MRAKARRLLRAPSSEEIEGVDRAGAGVGVVEHPPIWRGGGAVGDAVVAIVAHDPPRIEAVQRAAAIDPLIVHRAEPQPPGGVDKGVVQAVIERGILDGMERIERARCRVEDVKPALQARDPAAARQRLDEPHAFGSVP